MAEHQQPVPREPLEKRLSSAAASRSATLLCITLVSTAIAWTAWDIVADADSTVVTFFTLAICLPVAIPILLMLPQEARRPPPPITRRRASSNSMLVPTAAILLLFNLFA